MTERVIIKLGGATLFHPAGFVADLRSVLKKYEVDQVFVMVGGGDLVEGMRTAHRIYPQLDPVAIHWRCVALLEHSLAIAREVLPLDGFISTRSDLKDCLARAPIPQHVWLSVDSFYSRSRVDDLPSAWRPKSNWDTTTDALAWLAGKVCQADRVVLVKQCELDPSWNLRQASELGIIDNELARLAEGDDSEMRIELI